MYIYLYLLIHFFKPLIIFTFRIVRFSSYTHFYICIGFNLIDHAFTSERNHWIFHTKISFSTTFEKSSPIPRNRIGVTGRETYRSVHISQARSSQGERCYCRPPLSFGISRWPRKSIVRSSILSSRSILERIPRIPWTGARASRGERCPLPEGSASEKRIYFYNLVEDRGGEHLLVTVLHAVPLLPNPSAPVATSETRQSLRLLHDTLHDVAKRLRRASHIRARFVWKFVPMCEKNFLFYTVEFIYSFFFQTGISNRESETNCRRKYSRKMHEICVNARRILMTDVHT